MHKKFRAFTTIVVVVLGIVLTAHFLLHLIPQNICQSFGMSCEGIFAQDILPVILIPIGIWLALQYNDIGIPELSITLSPPSDFPKTPEGYIRHLYLSVSNIPEEAPLVTPQSATNCHGTISVLTNDGNIIFEKMPIRWADNPEPIKAEFDPKTGDLVQILDPRLIRSSRFITLPPSSSESEKIDTVSRIERDKEAYGWTGMSYVHGRHWKDFEVPTGEYILRVQLSCDQRIFPPVDFIIRNPAEFKDFKLEESIKT